MQLGGGGILTLLFSIWRPKLVSIVDFHSLLRRLESLISRSSYV